MKIAVIDVGSNSIRLGIYVSNGGLKEIFSRRISTRLARGIGADKNLSSEAMSASVDAFVKFKRICSEHNVHTIKAVATESLRRGENSGEFIKKVYDKTGIEIEIIDGEAECRLGAFAAMQSAREKDFYVLDTGGGSAELSLVLNGEVQKSVCMPLGGVVITEKFNPDINGCDEMYRYIDTELEKHEWVSRQLPVVVMGGSNKMLAKIILKTTEDEKIDSARIPTQEIVAAAEMLVSCSVCERLKIYGMEENRAEYISAGLAPLLRLCERVKPKIIIFSSKSIREGVAAELYDAENR